MKWQMDGIALNAFAYIPRCSPVPAGRLRSIDKTRIAIEMLMELLSNILQWSGLSAWMNHLLCNGTSPENFPLHFTMFFFFLRILRFASSTGRNSRATVRTTVADYYSHISRSRTQAKLCSVGAQFEHNYHAARSSRSSPYFREFRAKEWTLNRSRLSVEVHAHSEHNLWMRMNERMKL